MKQEKSCGVICYTYNEKNELCVLLIKHRFGGHWAFPKGHVEANETEQETALRELLEETGANAEILPNYREVTTYSPAKGVMKDVIFFVGKYTGGALHCQPEEVRKLEMVPVKLALTRLTFAADKLLLNKAIQAITQCNKKT